MESGTTLGPYEIREQIGAGGMGEVYRANDTSLNRQVAIKVLPTEFAQDTERLARFEREAKTLASLNHPNIAQIYGFEKSTGVHALVMELVDGPTLADRITQGPIPIDEALPIAKQIAEALEAAHEQGIIHRDLKSANVKVRSDGTVKVLDFGLAKAMDPVGDASSVSMSPTLSMAATQAGIILGTAAYMSPEQARGKTVDKRADIWSFGVVLYEMVTSKNLFAGEDLTDTLASVVKVDPDISDAPSELHPLLKKCLEKDPRKRLRDISGVDLLLDLGRAKAAVHGEVLSTSEARSKKWLWPAVSAILAVIAISVSFVHFQEPAPVQQTLRYQIPTQSLRFLTVSPDGRHLAYLNRFQLWIHSLDELEPRPVPGTDGATYPFWSPDSEFLGFFAQGQLKKIALAGGPAITLADAVDSRGGSWSSSGDSDGVIIFGRLGLPLLQVSSAGGTPEPVAGQGNSSIVARFPAFLPDGVHFFYMDGSQGANSAGVYIGSLDGDAPVRILPDNVNALYASPSEPGGSGYVLFRREETLMAQPFSPSRLETTGEAVPVAEQVTEAGQDGFGAYSVSARGLLVYVSRGEGNRQLVWMDRDGNRLGNVSTPSPILDHSLSPDGTSVAMQRGLRTAQSDIWLQQLDGDSPTRLTFTSGGHFGLRWTPDGDSLTFGRGRIPGPAVDIVRIPADGGSEELVSEGGINTRPLDWSPDNGFLVYSETGPATGLDILLLPLAGDREPVPYLRTPATESPARLSPDGRWIAYVSNESGLLQVYVQDLPATGRKYQISTAATNARQPVWRQDGRELFFWSMDQLMAVSMALGESLQHGTPQALFNVDGLRGGLTNYDYDSSGDGQRFLVNVPAEGETANPSFTVVSGWQAALGR